MLKEHTNLAISCGVKEENTFICTNGDIVIMDDAGCHRGKRVQAGDVYVDGSRIGDIGSVVIKDRKIMSNDGVLVTILNINPDKHQLLIKPNITTRGFVLVNENAELIKEIENKVADIVNKSLSGKYNVIDIKNQVILELNMFISEKTGRRPMILPVIMEVKK